VGYQELVVGRRRVSVGSGGGKQWASRIMECHSETLGVRGLGDWLLHEGWVEVVEGSLVVAWVLKGDTTYVSFVSSPSLLVSGITGCRL
jgi:hypothetical protein